MTTNEQAGGRKKPSRHSVKRRYYKGGSATQQIDTRGKSGVFLIVKDATLAESRKEGR